MPIPSNLNTESPPVEMPNAPRTMRAASDGSGDYPRLHSAVADLLAGSKIILDIRTFALQKSRLIDKSLNIQASGSEKTIITLNHADGVIDFVSPGDLALIGITFLRR